MACRSSYSHTHIRANHDAEWLRISAGERARAVAGLASDYDIGSTLQSTAAMVHAVLPYSEISRFHDDYYRPNRPVVIRGVRDHRSCEIFKWSLDYLAARMSRDHLPVMQTQTGFLSYERDFVAMPFGEFAEKVLVRGAQSATRYYFKNPTKLLPTGCDDSARIDELRPYLSKAKLSNLWISGPGLTVGLHFDPADNLNFQLRGKKSFWLFPPGVGPYYPLPMFSQLAHISGVFRNGPNVDLADFPRFDPSRGMRVDLEEGDILYLPAYWWHQVDSLGEENLNLNFWWFPTLTKQLKNWNQALRGHAQMGLRYISYGNFQQAPGTKGNRE
jgi:hypothetical protein